MPKLPTLKFEKQLSGLVAGVDEAGIGPLAGPVVAAAVIFQDRIPKGINDSKKLVAKIREEIFAEIKAVAVVGVGLVSVVEIDRINIYHAARLAMQRAVENLAARPDHILVDGVRPPKFACPAEAIIKGDSISKSIAAASIIAKVTRDKIMDELHQEFPVFGWDSNRGYPTKTHREALLKHGITIHHRRSFGPVREIYKRQEPAIA